MNVPKLRFKEFTDEWTQKQLSEIVTFSKGNLLSKLDLDENGIYPCILYGELYTKYREVIREVFSKTNYNSNNITKSKCGDILIPSSGETSIDISTSSCLLLNDILLGGDINILSPKNCDGRFVSYMINNNKRKDIAKVAQGYSVVHLYHDNLRKINLNIPALEEQKKIADLLELLDKKIELQTKKIEALKLFKLYIQKKLFSERIIDEICINQLGNIITGTTPSKNENSYWDNGEYTWVTPSDINDKRDIETSNFKLTNEGLKKGRFIPKNSILVTCIASIGKNAVMKVDGSCNQQINAIVPNVNYNYNYIYYLIENISKYMQSIAGTSATSIINKEQFGNITVNVHDKEWQNKIDNVLSTFENKIQLEEEKINYLNNLKKGLMQNMFV